MGERTNGGDLGGQFAATSLSFTASVCGVVGWVHRGGGEVGGGESMCWGSPFPSFTHRVEHLNRGLIHAICGVETFASAPSSSMFGIPAAAWGGWHRCLCPGQCDIVAGTATCRQTRSATFRCGAVSLLEKLKNYWWRRLPSPTGGMWG